MRKYYINPDITKAETLPNTFYKSSDVFGTLMENLFGESCHWIGDSRDVLNPNQNVAPIQIMEEPIVLVEQKNGEIQALSNVCTHRANKIIHEKGKHSKLRCEYHGRQFKLDGKFLRMPEFEQAKNFPRDCDHLHRFKTFSLGPHLFVGLGDLVDFEKVINQMQERIGFLPLEAFKKDQSLSKDYTVNCHWALYCDNYLEGFHIPFVHEDLNETLDYGSYETVIYDQMNLQIGYSEDPKSCFELPEHHPDYGKNVAAYYYWIFPNMMFNFYPWGLSVNIVKPISPNRTKVSFISYVWDPSKLEEGAGALLDKVEREDEFVVEGVHQGLKSKFYTTGRFSPTREQGVHHFHLLLSKLFE